MERYSKSYVRVVKLMLQLSVNVAIEVRFLAECVIDMMWLFITTLDLSPWEGVSFSHHSVLNTLNRAGPQTTKRASINNWIQPTQELQ